MNPDICFTKCNRCSISTLPGIDRPVLQCWEQDYKMTQDRREYYERNGGGTTQQNSQVVGSPISVCQANALSYLNNKSAKPRTMVRLTSTLFQGMGRQTRYDQKKCLIIKYAVNAF